MIRCIVYILCLFLPFSVAAKDIVIETMTLGNGMQVVVIPNKKVPAVSHMVWYKVGAIDEELGKSGLAHYLEHLMFKGTARFGSGVFSEKVARSGGNDNAFTTYDATAYYQNIARDKLEMVMEMEADRMHNLLFNSEEILRERDVILEERRMRVDSSPSAILREQMQSALFLNHPYGRPLIGWQHEMEALTEEDAHQFYVQYYHPSNAVVVVSGDITLDEFRPLAQKYYAPILPRDVSPRRQVSEPQQKAARFIVLSDVRTQQEEWRRYYLAPSVNTKGKEHSYALLVLSRMLGDTATSYLYEDLVINRHKATAVSSSYDDINLGPSVFAFQAVPAPGVELKALEQEVEASILRFLEEGITSSRLKRAKKALITETIYAREDLKTMAYIVGFLAATGVDLDYVNNWNKNIKKVSLRDVKEAAQYVFKDSQSVTGWLVVQEEK